jgi:signal transduction protein with GAF and PtsI domain
MQGTTFRTSFERQSSASVFTGESHQAIAPLLDLALAETNAQGAYLYRFDQAARSARVVASTGLALIAGAADAELQGAPITIHFGRNAPIVLHDAAWSDPRFETLPEFRKNRFEGVVSLPLLDAGQVVGMLNVCRSRRVALQPRELSFLLGLGVPIGAVIGAVAAKRSLEREVEKLARRLEDRGVVERAKGLIQERLGWTEEQAYFCIRNLSRRRRMPMRKIALEVIDRGASHLSEEEGLREA